MPDPTGSDTARKIALQQYIDDAAFEAVGNFDTVSKKLLGMGVYTMVDGKPILAAWVKRPTPSS